MRSFFSLFVGAFSLVCFTLGGCNNQAAQPRSALLENATFANAVNDCAQHDQLTTAQLVTFAGTPDLTLPWGQIEKTLANRAGFDKEAVAHAMQTLRDKYALNKRVVTGTPSMDLVDVWFYRWNEPAKLVVSDPFHTPVGKGSILILVENGHVVGLNQIIYR